MCQESDCHERAFKLQKKGGGTEAPSTTDFERSETVFLSDKETGGSTAAAAAVTRAVVKRKPDFVFKILRLNSCLGWAADWQLADEEEEGQGQTTTQTNHARDSAAKSLQILFSSLSLVCRVHVSPSISQPLPTGENLTSIVSSHEISV